MFFSVPFFRYLIPDLWGVTKTGEGMDLCSKSQVNGALTNTVHAAMSPTDSIVMMINVTKSSSTLRAQRLVPAWCFRYHGRSDALSISENGNSTSKSCRDDWFSHGRYPCSTSFEDRWTNGYPWISRRCRGRVVGWGQSNRFSATALTAWTERSARLSALSLYQSGRNIFRAVAWNGKCSVLDRAWRNAWRLGGFSQSKYHILEVPDSILEYNSRT